MGSRGSDRISEIAADGALTDSSAPGTYAEAWRRYRLWSLAFWLLFFAFVPSLGLLNRVIPQTGNRGSAIFTAAITWMIAFTVVGYFKTNFACPRCGELYFRRFDTRPWRRTWIYRPWARRCMHCGLPKWADRDDSARSG